MAYSDIDSGKVLNKEGLLELCSQIKTEIANNSGGSSYTAGDGINIDNNGVISLPTSRMSLVPMLYSIMTRNSGKVRQEGFVQQLWHNKFMKENMEFHIGNLQIYRMTYFSNGMNADTIQSLIAAFYDTPPSVLAFHYNASAFDDQYSYAMAQTSFAPTDNNRWQNLFINKPVLAFYHPDEGNVKWTFIIYPEKLFQNIYFNSQAGLTSHSMAGAIDEVATRIPTAPTADGTYMLKCVVSSGTPAYSWESVNVGGSY